VSVVNLFPAYVSLWRRIQSEGVWIHYNGLATDEDGHFVPDGCGSRKAPEIQLTRSRYMSPQHEPSEFLNTGLRANIQKELITLAHEYGHYLSWKSPTTRPRWDRYHAVASRRDRIAGQAGWDAVAGGLSYEEKGLVVDEESLAWSLGRPFVPEHLLAEFDERARRGIHYHRFRLWLDELWPDDAPGQISPALPS